MAIRAFWPGATAQQVAEQVTDKLEKTLQEVPYVDMIRSYSKPGESLIIFQVKDSSPPKEMPQIWYQVRKKIGDMRGTLPPGVIGPFFNDEFGDVYGIDLCALGRRLQRRGAEGPRRSACASACCRCKDVAKVEIFGAQDEKIFVEISQQAPRPARPRLQPGARAARPAERGRVGRHDQRRPSDFVQVRVGGSSTRSSELAAFPIRAGGARFTARRHRESSAATSTRRRSRCAHQGKQVIALGISMAPGRRHHRARQGAEGGGRRDPRRAAGGHRAAPVPGPARGRVALGQRVRRRADRGGADRAGGELHRARPAPQAACASTGGRGWSSRITIPLVLAITFVVDVLLGRRPAQDLARLADHRAGPAGRRRDHRGRDDGAQARGGLRQGPRRHLRLRGDRDADAHRHADHRGRLPADRHGEVDGRRIHVRDLRGHHCGAADLVVRFGLLRALPRHRLLRERQQQRADAAEPHDLFDTPFYVRFRAWSTGASSTAGSRSASTIADASCSASSAWARCSSSSSPIRAGPRSLVDLWFPEGTSFAANEAVDEALRGAR